jgi:PAS domain S-box-containing protein
MTGRPNRMRLSAYWRPLTACMRMLIPLALLSALPLGATERSKTVLAIYSDERLLPANQALDTALRDSLGLETDNPPAYLSEFLDVSRFGSSAYDKLVSDFFRNKYAGQHLDVIIAAGPLAFQFLRRHQADLFTGIPVVLCGVDRDFSQTQPLPPNFVGVPIAIEPLPTIELALRLQPDAREIVIVTGASEFDRSWEATLRSDLPHLQTSVPIRYLSGLPLDDVLRELSRLSPNSIVYSPGLFRDGAGTTYIPRKVLRRMAVASTAPIYGSYSTHVGAGIVGGYMFTMEDLGRETAGLVQKFLDEEKVSQADVPGVLPSRYVFDWKQLQRWHIPEKKLPPGSTVLYRELSAWQRYKWYIVGGIAILLAQALLIFGLLWQRARRRKVEEALLTTNTELKKSEGVLRESEERFRLVADTAPALIWMSGTDKLCTFFNKGWLDFTGRSIDLEIGNGWAEGVHLEDFQTCFDTYLRAFDARQKFTMEYRLRRYDGEYRWVLDIGVPRFNQDGSFAGFIGSCVDVTDRKLAEEALSGVNRKLIEAQERERTRIARELHDDIAQRLALLTVELGQFDSPHLPADVGSRIGELRIQSSEIAADVQSLSHELHSSKLEYLGIATAMRGFCREFSEQQKVEIEFENHDLPSPLSPDISLCLFRIMQEALHNSAKYSGVRHFEVRLCGTSDEIYLTVSDSGAGFDVKAAKEGRGLGLTSMEERLKLVRGTISIESQPKRGTTIHARVPLSSGSHSMRAAG